MSVILAVWALCAALAVSLLVWSLRPPRGLWLIALSVPLVLAAEAAVGLPHPETVLSSVTAFGPLRFAAGPWSGAWMLVFECLVALAAWIFLSTGGGRAHLLSVVWCAVAIGGLVSARTPLAVVVSWGVLAAGSYAAVLSGSRAREKLSAGFAMLALTEVGAGILLVGALLLALRVSVPPGVVASLGIIGLGSKAGIFPFQTWLPVAEPEAPGAGAGMLSGAATGAALIVMMRWLTWAPMTAPVAWGMVVLGLLGAVVGAVHAMLDVDFKRVLAYSTVEWVGLILTALGLSFVFAAAGLGTAAALTRDAAALLILVHSFGKFAAFVTAGWLERALGHRSLDGAGGLLRRAPWIGGAVLLALGSLLALPPTGGYVAEWMSVEGLFAGAASSMHGVLVTAGIAAALAVGAGATAMFRWFTTLFLGPCRTEPVAPPTAAETVAVSAAALAAALCGPAVQWLVPWLSRVAPGMGAPVAGDIVAPTFTSPAGVVLLIHLGGGIFRGLPGAQGTILFPGPGFTATSPWDLLWFGLILLPLVALGARLMRRGTGLAPRRVVQPWTGGLPYRHENAWSAMGTAHPLRLSFARLILLERERAQVDGQMVLRHEHRDRLLEQVFRPLLALWERVGRQSQRMQSGRLGHYLGYLVAVLTLATIALKVTGQI